MVEDNTDDALFRKLKKQFKADAEFSKKWRAEAKEDFDFVAGEQWSETDKQHLKDLMRPPITMNVTGRVINAVSGQEMGNQREVRYLPREPGDVKPNEILTEAARWFKDGADGDDADSEAFLSTTICGMGWTDTTLDYEDEEEGAPNMASPSPLKMYWDRNARANNLTDAKRIWYVWEGSIADAQEQFPEVTNVADLDAKWARAEGDDGETKDQDRERFYEDDKGDGEPADLDDDKLVTIVHCEYKVPSKSYKVVSPLSGETSEMDEATYRTWKKRSQELGLPVHSTQLNKKTVKQAFLGGKVLQYGEALCPESFRFQCVTGFRDENKGTFYGLVRSMKDPQRWANKWLSQTMHLMNAQAQGGVMVERDALDDVRDFEKTWARVDKPTYVPPGTLSNANGPKIVPKPVAQFPQGFYQLMEFSFNMVRETVGVSVEMMGMADRDQPASLEYQRRQAGMVILQPLFKNLKRYLHEHGRLMLYLIQNYLSDGRLIRIVGQDQEQYIPLVRQSDIKYDIVVDDMPTSPNQREMAWSMLSDKLELFPPEAQMVILKEFSPMPSAVGEKIEAAMDQASQAPMMQLQQRMAEIEAQLNESKTKLTDAQTVKTVAEAQKTAAEVGQGVADPNAELNLEYQKMQGQMALQHQKQAGDFQLKATQMQQDHALKSTQMQQDQALKSNQAQGDQAIKRQSSSADSATKRDSMFLDAAIKARAAKEAAKNKPAEKRA